MTEPKDPNAGVGAKTPDPFARLAEAIPDQGQARRSRPSGPAFVPSFEDHEARQGSPTRSSAPPRLPPPAHPDDPILPSIIVDAPPLRGPLPAFPRQRIDPGAITRSDAHRRKKRQGLRAVLVILLLLLSVTVFAIGLVTLLTGSRATVAPKAAPTAYP